MSTEQAKAKRKRPSKGVRKHNRKLKQEARRISVVGNTGKKPGPTTKA